MLLNNQESCQKQINSFMANTYKPVMIIEGEKNIGKITTIFATLNNSHVAYFKNEQSNSKKYLPFYNVINDKKNIFTSVVSSSDVIAMDFKPAPHLLSLVLKVFNHRHDNAKLNEEEKNILSYIQRLVQNKKNYVFVIENVCEWDPSSIALLSILYCSTTTNDRHNLKWIFTSNSNEETKIIKNNFIKKKGNEFVYYKIHEMELNDFIKCMKFFDDKQIYSENDYESLFKIIGSDIEAIKCICKSNFSNEIFEDNVEKSTLIKNIIEKKLRELNANGELIIQTMEYMGILNEIVSINELTYVLERKEGEIRTIIDEANNYYLLIYNDNQQKYINFALSIVKAIYTGVTNYDKKYYSKIANCIFFLYPVDYEKRGDMLINAGENGQAGLCYSLEVIKQIRSNQQLDPKIKRKLELTASTIQREFVNSYARAISLFLNNDYNETINVLECMSTITDIELQAERDIFLSLCFTKKFSERQKALDILERYDSCTKINNEIDIWERVLDRKLFANIHLGDLKSAKQIEEDLILSYGSRINHDRNILAKLIRLNIRSNSLYSAEVSLQKNKDAHKLFLDENLESILLYYFILTNESAANIINGEFREAYNLCREGEKIIQSEEYITFPRKEILLNNYILSGFLCGEFSVDYCLESYEVLLKNIPDSAEKLFYTSNYCIFLSLAGKNKDAFKMLEKESDKQFVKQLDKESIYNFRVCYNLAVFSYLSGDENEINKYLDKLENISIGQIDHHFVLQKKNLTMELIKNNQKYTPEEWLYALHKQTSGDSEKPWRYYGLGYAFTALSNWNDI